MKCSIPFFYFLILAGLFTSCTTTQNEKPVSQIFEAVSAKTSGLNFENRLTENDSVNYFTYPYIYMGGGVSIGDINNDGLADIYLTGNMVENKLYLNKGDLQFEDITQKAGVAGDQRWVTGCTMADVNGDGLLDIYVSVSGKSAPRENLLYINNGDLTFSEKAQKYGLADAGNTTQATFFDYDKDGDLDVYVANYPITPFKTPVEQYRYLMDNVTWEKSDHLYRNDGNETFTDVTEEAGVLQFGLSLSATASDVNQDGWPDIYVSNDFSSPDYFFLNNGDGTFSERLQQSTKQVSMFGMGADIGDFNNDGLLDIVQMDMNPEDNRRNKANMASMNPGLFWGAVSSGLHYQYMQNSLQLNMGVQQGVPVFSNIARFAGVSSTDWSWAPLFVDLDNDGWKDIFISNGTRRDINNKDYFIKLEKKKDIKKNGLKYALEIPSEKVDNYAFRNNADFSFDNVIQDWGLSFEGFSNGAAYGDLDNDGDMDLVVSNIDSLVSLFENHSADIQKQHYLQFRPQGPKNNVQGLGTKIQIEYGDKMQFQELSTTRGFQSSVQALIHFGLGKETSTVDKVIITWPDGKQEIMQNVKADQILKPNYTNAKVPKILSAQAAKPLFEEITEQLGIDYRHQENFYNDFAYEPLLPHRTSQFGPGLAVGDVNGDKLEDFFVGGAADSYGLLHIQQPDGTFELADSQVWTLDSLQEDMGAAFLDVEGDGDLDLLVVSGGNEFDPRSPRYLSRLYLNDGKGSFSKSEDALPKVMTSGSCVRPADYDKDGDLDIFIGGRLNPQRYPEPGRSYILRNDSKDGKAKFSDVTEEVAPGLSEAGLVTDATWIDYDKDDQLDLVIVGEWMPISFFRNEGGTFANQTKDLGLEKTSGWWFSLLAEDFDKDGDQDFIVGNLGLNYKYQASEEESFDVYSGDFDKNGELDIVLGYYSEGIQYPVRGRQCSSEQIPAIKYKFKSYDEFAIASLEDVYTADDLDASLHYQAWTFASSYLENKGDGSFEIRPLVQEAQFSSVHGIIAKDVDVDGHLDLVLAGNLFVSEVETPRNDGSMGLFLRGNGKGDFSPVSLNESGFYAPWDVREMASIQTEQGEVILVANNNSQLQAIRVGKAREPKKVSLK